MNDFDKFVTLLQSWGFKETTMEACNWLPGKLEYVIYKDENINCNVVWLGDGGAKGLGYSSFSHGFAFDVQTGKYSCHGAAE